MTLEQAQVLCDNMKKEQQAPHPANRGRVGRFRSLCVLFLKPFPDMFPYRVRAHMVLAGHQVYHGLKLKEAPRMRGLLLCAGAAYKATSQKSCLTAKSSATAY